MRYIYISLFKVFILFFFILVPITHAQQISMTISPPLKRLIMKPGSTISFKYSIENVGDPTAIKIRIVSVKPADNQGRLQLSDSVEGPIQFSISTNDEAPISVLKTKQSRDYTITIRVPDGAPEKDYYYTILAENSPFPAPEGQSSMRIQSGIGSHLFISITSNAQLENKAKISVFSVLNAHKIPFMSGIHIYDSDDPIPLYLEVSNLGKNLIQPKGTVIVTGINYKKTYDILPKYILNSSQRVLVSNDMLRNCKGCPHNITTSINQLSFGKYTASTSIKFFDGSSMIYGTTQFYVFPFKLFFIVIVVVITSIFSYFKLYKR